jgi:iron-sulfur cluster repair protein YtfE (RIC family)
MSELSGYLLIHAGIRSELHRLAALAEGVAAGRRHAGPRQLAALRSLITDVFDTIHHHHVGEDEHLWPLLRTVPGIDAGLAALEAEHGLLDPLMHRIANHTDPADLAESSRELADLMDRHLAAEEALVVPTVREHIRPERYAAMEKAMRRGGAKPKLSFVVPWLAAADPVRFAEVAREQGVVFRILHRLTRGAYERRVWAAYGASAIGPVTLTGRAEQFVAAAPGAVYDLLADVTRMGRFSPECHRVEWLDGAGHSLPGARFRGHNRFGLARWSRECVVITADPGAEFAFRTVPERTKSDSTLWRFVLRPVDGGTLVTQTFELSANRLVMLFERLSGRVTGTPAAMRQTLRQLGDAAVDKTATVR